MSNANGTSRGFAMMEKALALFERMDWSLQQMTALATDRARNAYAEGCSQGGPIVVGPTGITMSGWNSPNIVDANPNRGGLNIQNTSGVGGPNVTLGLGNTTPTVGSGIVLPPGASWDGRISGKLYRGSVSARASAAGATVSTVESG